MFMLPTGGSIGTSVASSVRRHTGGGTAPEIFGIPTIVGGGLVGVEHSVEGYVLTGDPTPNPGHEWQVGGVTVSTDLTYTPTLLDLEAVGLVSDFSDDFSDDFGGSPLLTCIVSATNTAGSATPVATEGVMLIGQRPGLLGATILEQSALVGGTLTGSYFGEASEDIISYQWRRNGANVDGLVSASIEASAPGAWTLVVTAQRDGSSFTAESPPAYVYHVDLSGVVGSNSVSNKTTTFASAAEEIEDQQFVILVSWSGGAATEIVVAGVTLTSFTEGASATTGGKTLTCRRVNTQSSSRALVLTLEGLTGTKDVAFEITTSGNHTFLKAHCYQTAFYDLSSIALQHTVGSSSPMSVEILKPTLGIAVVFANRMPTLESVPAGWVTGFSTNPSTSGHDVHSGYIAGMAPFQGNVSFVQPNATTDQQIMGVTMLPQAPIFPEITSEPTISGTARQGATLTSTIASVTGVVDRVLVRFYKNTTPRVGVSESVEYVIGSGAPLPTYVPTESDIGSAIVVGQTPAIGLQFGAEVFSDPTSAVVSADAETPPAKLDNSKFTFVGTSEADGGIKTVGGVLVQTADTTIKSGITIQEGWKLGLLRSLVSNLSQSSTHSDMQLIKPLSDIPPDGLGISYDGTADKLWRSGGGATHGTTQYLYAFWISEATGAKYDALNYSQAGAPLSFVSDTGTTPPPDDDFPVADQLLTAATSAKIVEAVNAEIAGNVTAGTWIVDLPAGNYGVLNLTSKVLPRKLILRSANLNLGAKFTQIIAPLSTNIILQFIHLDRSASPAIVLADGETAGGRGIDFRGSTNCGLEYCNIDAGVSIKRTDGGRTGIGWIAKLDNLIDVAKYDNTRKTSGFRAYMNYIHGSAMRGLEMGGASNGYFAENVFADICGDDIQMGSGCNNNQFINNWGSRIHYPTKAPGEDWVHTDFIQIDARLSNSDGNIFIGNVLMKGDWNAVGGWTGIPSQGLFCSKSLIRNGKYLDNIIISNCRNAVSVEHGTNGAVSSGHEVRRNSTLKLVDDTFLNQKFCLVDVGGTGVTRSHNIACGPSTYQGMGTDGINIVTTDTDFDGAEDYYESIKMTSSFYESRPKVGKETHWGYTGIRVGAYQRYYDVIVLGKYPKVGPAATAWKTWYDPRNQITS